jgi:hypothetical protein
VALVPKTTSDKPDVFEPYEVAEIVDPEKII